MIDTSRKTGRCIAVRVLGLICAGAIVIACTPKPDDGPIAGTTAPADDASQRTETPSAQSGALSERSEAPSEAMAVARAELAPTAGNEAIGTIEFREATGGQLVISARLTGLSPGRHGFHIHESGDCSGQDAQAAGDHFAPQGDPHGSPDAAAAAHHAGDLGNVTASEDGSARSELTDDELELTGEFGILDRAVVVHTQPDDLETQPSGGAGEPVACGVIRLVPSG